VFVDEAGFNLHMIRRFGRAPRGRRPVRIRPTAKGKNLSVVVAASREGIIASEVKLGAYNTPSFENFLLEKVVSTLTAPRVFIMDNARCHTSLSIKTTLNVEDTLYNDSHLIAPTLMLPSPSSVLSRGTSGSKTLVTESH